MKFSKYIYVPVVSLFSFLLFSCASNDDVLENDEAPIANQVTINACSNVVIVNGYAYGACGGELGIVSLEDDKRNVLNIPSDDITIDSSTNTLFVQSRNSISALNITNPLEPSVVATTSTNFGLFSGIDAANGVVVVSAGTRGNNTQVYQFNGSQFNLSENGIQQVDAVTGNPDVHVTETSNGARAFYSQDLGGVANWGIQIVDFNTSGNVINTEDVVVLTPLRFTGSFSAVSPANFPVESEFLNNKLYVAHFAVNGIEIVDFDNNNAITRVDLGYSPVNVTTDGLELFAIGTNSKEVSILNPSTNNITSITVDAIEQARGVAASKDYIVIADRNKGLIVVNR